MMMGYVPPPLIPIPANATEQQRLDVYLSYVFLILGRGR